MDNKLRYIRYSRKSSEAKEKQVASVNDQNSECGEYATREGLRIAYRLEENKSAFKPNKRLAFKEMIELIETGKADAILVWNVNRLSRNPLEGGQIMQLLLDGKIKEIRVSNGEKYTQDTNSFVLQIQLGMSTEFSSKLGRDVKRGLKHKVERGEYPARKFYGYSMVGEKGRKNLKPHTFESPLITKSFELASSGQYSLTHISTYLFSKGLTGKNGKKITKEGIRRILTRTAYYGFFEYKGELYKGDYTSLITKSLFDSVQEALKDRSKPKVHIWGKVSYNGLLKCPCCNSAITTTYKIKHYKGTNRTVKYVYLHSTKRKGQCTESPVPIAEFEKKMLDKISQISIDKEVWDLGIELLKAKNKEELNINHRQSKKYHKEYLGVQAKISQIIEMRANDELTKKEFMIQKQLYLQESARLDGLVNDIKDSANNWLELAEEFLDNAFYARSVMESDKVVEKRKLLMAVGENFYLTDKSPQFSFKKPYDVLLKPQYRHSGRE